jgi:hypothetical protein
LRKTIPLYSARFFMKYPVLLLSWFFLNLFFSSPLLALSCPSSPSKAVVTAKFLKANPYLNNRASPRRLARKSGRRGYHDGKTIGLTESGLSLKVLTSFSVETSNLSKQSCVTLQTIQLEYGFRKTSVLIDRRYRPDSCEYAAIYHHEAEHVRIMNRKGLSYYRWLKQQVANRVRSITPVLTRRPRRVQRYIAARVKKMAAILIGQMEKNLSAAHAVIDTSENYQRTQDLCSNW